jgi:hypothetical protein
VQRACYNRSSRAVVKPPISEFGVYGICLICLLAVESKIAAQLAVLQHGRRKSDRTWIHGFQEGD